jgi:hypothetical protein
MVRPYYTLLEMSIMFTFIKTALTTAEAIDSQNYRSPLNASAAVRTARGTMLSFHLNESFFLSGWVIYGWE